MFSNRLQEQEAAGRDPLIGDLLSITGPGSVLYKHEDLVAYECDGYVIHKAKPRAVVFPSSTEEVSRVVKLLYSRKIPFIPRGAGTGLSGGAIPIGGEVLISLVRMKKLLKIDLPNRRAVVQPGYINLKLSNSIAEKGYYYAPDPSSQRSCTIGGNIGENAGGAHCLKYGVTTNHVLGLQMVLPDGEILELGGVPDVPGYDLIGLITGSEGTLGIVTEITVRVLKKPEALKTVGALFDRVEDASHAVSDIISAGIIPAALEMMDQTAIEGVERGNYPVGYPKDLGAVLLIEVDGIAAGIEEQAEQIIAICEKRNVREVRAASSEAERTRWWNNRKQAFGAMGTLSADYIVQDGVIPRSKLPEVLAKIADISNHYGLRIANVFHAGDGNLHPLVLFDARVPGETDKAIKAGSEVLKACADVGGTITGEHGVGIEKKEEMRYVFSEEEIALQLAVRDVFNPENLCNPDKMFPSPSRCVEVKQAAAAAP
ncbi:FAD-linked oxidase C-terminal domain-containing protein [Ferviditalea candida]|uniref:FAD-linked oxidase C-terminal domain-containing protein n=1 Tax=Ferviditalea candida TaxID=3108399 RepID=A0ABU5ZIW4_9BACL|nr:FAD-linked oxidase C-terminal domain-containing protein [Paenibacillaceae bacterium T2]